MRKLFISILFLVLTAYSCQFSTKKNKTYTNTPTVKDDSSQSDSNRASDEKLLAKQMKSIEHKRQQTNKSIYIFDSLKLNLDLLIDTVRKYNPELPIIHPIELSDDLPSVFPLDDSTLLITFFIDNDFEITRLTKWKLTKDSTLKYQGRLKPDFYTKYAFIRILEKISVNRRTILIGETSGGEGGTIWQKLWVSYLNNKDSLIELGSYITGYDDGENRMSLEYKINGNNILIFEKTDSTIYSQDSMIIIPLSKKKVKVIKLRKLENKMLLNES